MCPRYIRCAGTALFVATTNNPAAIPSPDAAIAVVPAAIPSDAPIVLVACL